MNNKLWFVLLVAATLLLTTLSMTKMVKAEDNSTTDDVEEDMEHAETMYNGLGAKMRLLQLDKSVTRNYLYGQHVIDELKAKNLTENITQLEAINSQLGDVKTQIEDLLKTDLTNTNETVKQFVDLKAKAIDLTRQFSEILRTELTIEQRHAIRSAVDKEDFKEVETLNKEIRGAIWEYNADRAVSLLKAMGVTDQTLLDKVKSGNITSVELRTLLRETFTGLTADQKRAFLQQIKEDQLQKLNIRKEVFMQKFRINQNSEKRLKDLFDDGKLTYGEKITKLRVLMKDNMQERIREHLEDFREKWNETKGNNTWRNDSNWNITGRTREDGPGREGPVRGLRNGSGNDSDNRGNGTED